MEVKQVAELVNLSTREILGEEDVLLEDLSNVVDMGNAILNADHKDKYINTLVNQIGKIVVVDRVYAGTVPSVLMDSWEYGSVVQKIAIEMPEATTNQSWELEDGESYDPFVFNGAKAYVKFYNSKVTFEVKMSITEVQLKQSFQNGSQLNAFVSAIYNAINKAMRVKIDSLTMDTINNMTAETLYDLDNAGGYASKTGVRAVNLLKLYNDAHSDNQLEPEEAITNPEFIRFAAYQMKLTADRMSRISKLYNIGGKDKFTPKELMHIVMLSDFADAADVYLQSDTFHNEFTALPKSEHVPFWQGSGKTYDFDDITSINVKTAANHTVEAKGILGVMFDRDALGVTNLDQRVTSIYNPSAEFYNNWYKFDAGYFNDLNENFVVFYVAKASA